MKTPNIQSNKRQSDKISWLILGLLMLVQLALAACYASNGWVADMFASFAPYFLIGSFIMVIIVVIIEVKNYHNLWLNLTILLVFGMIILNYLSVRQWLYISNGTPARLEEQKKLRLASFNKLVVNDDLQSIQSAIADYDIVAISEITAEDFRELSRGWEYAAISNCGCDPAYGVEIAVLSTYKIDNIKTASAESGYGVALRAKIDVPDRQDLIIHAIHPPAPVSREAFKRRNAMLEQVVAPRVMADRKKPTVLVGDMNLSPYSSSYGQFAETIFSYKNAGQGVALWRTWCLGQMPLACAPIDHVFVSDQIVARPVRAIKVKGSDHMLIAIDIMIK